jgi:hypothetical protein
LVTRKATQSPARERRPRFGVVSSASSGSGKTTPLPPEETYEPLDAGKYVGYMRREGSGKFGSLPLYDGYGDEDFA